MVSTGHIDTIKRLHQKLLEMEKEKVKMREGRREGGEWEGRGRGEERERERESRGKESDFTANLIFSKRKSISSSTAKTPLRGHCEQQSLWEE